MRARLPSRARRMQQRARTSATTPGTWRFPYSRAGYRLLLKPSRSDTQESDVWHGSACTFLHLRVSMDIVIEGATLPPIFTAAPRRIRAEKTMSRVHFLTQIHGSAPVWQTGVGASPDHCSAREFSRRRSRNFRLRYQ